MGGLRRHTGWRDALLARTETCSWREVRCTDLANDNGDIYQGYDAEDGGSWKALTDLSPLIRIVASARIEHGATLQWWRPGLPSLVHAKHANALWRFHAALARHTLMAFNFQASGVANNVPHCLKL